MKYGKNHKRGIQDHNHLSNIHDRCLKFVYLKKVDKAVKTKKHRESSIFHNSFFTSRNPICSAKKEMISVPGNTTGAGRISLMIPRTSVLLIKLIITSPRGKTPPRLKRRGL